MALCAPLRYTRRMQRPAQANPRRPGYGLLLDAAAILLCGAGLGWLVTKDWSGVLIGLGVAALSGLRWMRMSRRLR